MPWYSKVIRSTHAWIAGAAHAAAKRPADGSRTFAAGALMRFSLSLQCDKPKVMPTEFACCRAPVRTFSMHGGAGALLSIGLLRAVGYERFARCVEGARLEGGDSFISLCLWEVSSSRHTECLCKCKAGGT